MADLVILIPYVLSLHVMTWGYHKAPDYPFLLQCIQERGNIEFAVIGDLKWIELTK